MSIMRIETKSWPAIEIDRHRDGYISIEQSDWSYDSTIAIEAEEVPKLIAALAGIVSMDMKPLDELISILEFHRGELKAIHDKGKLLIPENDAL